MVELLRLLERLLQEVEAMYNLRQTFLFQNMNGQANAKLSDQYQMQAQQHVGHTIHR